MVHDGAILFQIEDDDLCCLVHLRFGLEVCAKSIEIISESQHFEIVAEWYFALADHVHGHLVVEIDEIIVFLQDIGVVVGV
jgi:hypothetical protein